MRWTSKLDADLLRLMKKLRNGVGKISWAGWQSIALRLGVKSGASAEARARYLHWSPERRKAESAKARVRAKRQRRHQIERIPTGKKHGRYTKQERELCRVDTLNLLGERNARLMYEQGNEKRPLVGLISGDPPAGRSALDRRADITKPKRADISAVNPDRDKRATVWRL